MKVVLASEHYLQAAAAEMWLPFEVNPHQSVPALSAVVKLSREPEVAPILQPTVPHKFQNATMLQAGIVQESGQLATGLTKQKSTKR